MTLRMMIFIGRTILYSLHDNAHSATFSTIGYYGKYFFVASIVSPLSEIDIFQIWWRYVHWLSPQSISNRGILI